MTSQAKSKMGVVIVVLTLLSVCVLCAVVVLRFDIGGYQARTGAKLKAIDSTSTELKRIAAVLQSFVEESGRQPPKDISSVVEFFEEVQPGIVDSMLGMQGWLDPNTNSVIDAWRNPIRLVVQSRHSYRFISSGPNGKDESGKGDDLIYDFDPLKDRSTDQPNDANNNTPL